MDLDKIASATYDRTARKRDAQGPSGPSPEIAAQRAVQDAVMTERHHGFDLSAKDHHMKYERKQFAVVGEGTKSAQDKYREGYAKISWKDK